MTVPLSFEPAIITVEPQDGGVLISVVSVHDATGEGFFVGLRFRPEQAREIRDGIIAALEALCPGGPS